MGPSWLCDPRPGRVRARRFGTDQSAWREVAPAFEDRYRVVLFDNVGAGGSDISAYSAHRYHTMHSYADDLLEIMAVLEIRDAVYVGHSMACMVGIIAFHETMASNFYAWASGSAPAIMRNPERPDLATAFAESLTAMRPDIGVSISRMIYRTDVRELLPTLDVPTLVVQSRDDLVVPHLVSEYLVEKLPHARLADIDASGHLPHLSAPEEVISAMRTFLG